MENLLTGLLDNFNPALCESNLNDNGLFKEIDNGKNSCYRR